MARPVFSLPRVQVQSLVRELRSHKLQGVAKKRRQRDTTLVEIASGGVWQLHVKTALPSQFVTASIICA